MKIKKFNEAWPHTSTPEDDAYMDANREYEDALVKASNLLQDCVTIVGNAIASIRPDNRPEDEPSDEEKSRLIESVTELSNHLQSFINDN